MPGAEDEMAMKVAMLDVGPDHPDYVQKLERLHKHAHDFGYNLAMKTAQEVAGEAEEEEVMLPPAEGEGEAEAEGEGKPADPRSALRKASKVTSAVLRSTVASTSPRLTPSVVTWALLPKRSSALWPPLATSPQAVPRKKPLWPKSSPRWAWSNPPPMNSWPHLSPKWTSSLPTSPECVGPSSRSPPRSNRQHPKEGLKAMNGNQIKKAAETMEALADQLEASEASRTKTASELSTANARIAELEGQLLEKKTASESVTENRKALAKRAAATLLDAGMISTPERAESFANEIVDPDTALVALHKFAEHSAKAPKVASVVPDDAPAEVQSSDDVWDSHARSYLPEGA